MLDFNTFTITEALKKNVEVGGDCYDANAKQFMVLSSKDKKMVLVHGYVSSQTQNRIRYDHCWIENDNEVLDFSNGRAIKVPKILYYALGHVRDNELFKYSLKDVMKNLDKHEHWGPWDLKSKNEKIK